MKVHKNTLIFVLVLISIAFILYYGEAEKPIGGERDEYGCLGPAGYQWCPSKQKCMRMWEDYCEEYTDQFRGDENPELIDSFEECEKVGNPVMESYPRQCRANNKTFVEEINIDDYGT